MVRWRVGQRWIDWREPTRHKCSALIMGIINVTPDSFSDGGCHQDSNSAIEYALRLVESGADIVDVGGESTRPGADAVSADMEMERVLPVIAGIRARSDVLISVDTAKASVAASALGQGAHIVNDVSALTMDPDMLSVVADTDAGIIIMHMRGIPKNMQTQDLACSDIVGLVKDTLREGLRRSRYWLREDSGAKPPIDKST
jgi:dihydropteroate synthase